MLKDQKVVTIPKDLFGSIARYLKTGQHRSIAGVLREALGLMKERDRKARALRRILDKGIEQLEKGQGREITPDNLMKSIHKKIGLK